MASSGAHRKARKPLEWLDSGANLLTLSECSACLWFSSASLIGMTVARLAAALFAINRIRLLVISGSAREINQLSVWQDARQREREREEPGERSIRARGQNLYQLSGAGRYFNEIQMIPGRARPAHSSAGNFHFRPLVGQLGLAPPGERACNRRPGNLFDECSFCEQLKLFRVHRVAGARARARSSRMRPAKRALNNHHRRLWPTNSRCGGGGGCKVVAL